MIPRIITSAFTNAPVVNGSDRTCVINLLRKCLIDGFGSTLPIGGWTMPFINAGGTQACFRNNSAGGATGFFLQVDSLTSTTVNATIFVAYEIMTSETIGINGFGSILPNTFLHSTSPTSTARPWILIATDKWFILVFYRNNTAIPTKAQILASLPTTTTSCVCFGDFEKINQSDGFNCFFSWHIGGANAGFGNTMSSVSANIQQHYIARALSGVSGSIAVGTMLPPPSVTESPGSTLLPAYNAQSGLYTSKIMLNDGVARTMRGFLDQCIAPIHSLPFDNLENVPIGEEIYTAVITNFYPSAGSQAQYLFRTA